MEYSDTLAKIKSCTSPEKQQKIDELLHKFKIYAEKDIDYDSIFHREAKEYNDPQESCLKDLHLDREWKRGFGNRYLDDCSYNVPAKCQLRSYSYPNYDVFVK